jgi:hypothetical protein
MHITYENAVDGVTKISRKKAISPSKKLGNRAILI